MRIALLVAAKDLRQRLRSRSIILLGVVAPLGLALIFSQLLAGNTTFHAAWGVVDLDGGEVARSLRADVIEPLRAAGVADVTDLATEADAVSRVESKALHAAFVIPAGFTSAVRAGQPASLRVIGRPDAALSVDIARSVAARFGQGVVGVQLAVHTATALRGAPLDAAAQGAVLSAASSAPPPVALDDVAASLRQLSLPTYFSAAMAIMFLFFAAQAGMVSLFDERRQGTLARMLAGPIRPWTVLMGKAVGSVITAVVAMTVLVVATTALIGADWGPPLGVGALLVAAVIAAVGISALVTSFARTEDAAGAAGSAVAITLSILGGVFSPTSQAPELMARLSLVTPHGWFLRGLGDMHGAGASVVDALPAVGVLLAIGLLTGVLGFARARRMLLPG